MYMVLSRRAKATARSDAAIFNESYVYTSSFALKVNHNFVGRMLVGRGEGYAMHAKELPQDHTLICPK